MTERSLLKRKVVDRASRCFSLLAVALAVAAMLCILCTVAYHGWQALSLDFLVKRSAPYGCGGGIGNAILGTLAITLGASVVAVPLALLAGICLAEYAHGRVANALRFSANVMMGMPSVLVGLFIYMAVVVPTGHFSGFAGSLALSILMFPVIMRTTEDILRLVPGSLRESALALGMSRPRAILCIVCKSARNGLLTGVLMAVSRVSGETAPLLFTALFADSWVSGYFTQPTPSLPVLITEYTTNSPFAEMHAMGWGASLVVMAIILTVNVSTRLFLGERQANA